MQTKSRTTPSGVAAISRGLSGAIPPDCHSVVPGYGRSAVPGYGHSAAPEDCHSAVPGYSAVPQRGFRDRLPLRALRGAVLLAAVAAVAAIAHAEPAPLGDGGAGLLGNLSFGSRREPVDIRAQRLDSEYKARTFTFTGSVKVTQGDLALDADKLTVTLDQEARARVREVVAEGAVKIVQGERVATGGRAVFDQDKRVVVLSKEAKLQDGVNRLAGDTVTCYLDEQRCEAQGTPLTPVHVVIVPQAETTPGETEEKPQ